MLPLVTVVVPTRNRPEQIRACVGGIAKLRYPADRFELILVDDGSEIPVETLIGKEQLNCSLRILRRGGGGPAAARNAGLNAAAGALVAFTDDDCVPQPDWLTQLAAAHRAEPEAGLGGNVVNAVPRLCSEASQVLIDYLYDYFATRASGKGFYTSNNIAFPAGTLRELGGFDEKFPLAAGEDRELCDRWVRHGYPLVYVPDAAVGHWHTLNFYKYSRQQFTYGRGAWHFHSKRASDNGDRIRLEPVRFYSSLLGYPFRTYAPAKAVPIACLLAWSQAANACGFFYEGIFRRTAVRNGAIKSSADPRANGGKAPNAG